MKLSACLFLLLISVNNLWASDFSTEVKSTRLEQVNGGCKLNVEFKYNLSPTAKDALHKGISLTWRVLIKVKQQGLIWDKTVDSIEIEYRIQNHALLNLYSIKQMDSGERSVFSSLAAALDSISNIRDIPIQLDQLNKSNYIAVKVDFKREALPVPLRPFSYFDSQWALSSQWTVWPFQN